MIVILDYDMGNVYSIQNMLNKIGEKSVISRDPEIVHDASKLILPGIGSYEAGMDQLEKFDLINQIKVHSESKPLLGICLGMQLLGRKSEEGNREGLGLIPFNVVRFHFEGIKNSSKLKIPHMGWDYTTGHEKGDPITEGLPEGQRYYFVHSYHAVCDCNKNVLMTCEYGYPFAAAVKKDRIYGVQFHPEKSHKFGMEILKRFAQKV